MTYPTAPNHPFVVWGSSFLWFISMFAIIWSLLLFFFVGDMLVLTGTDMVNAIVLLSGIIMLPTNVHILSSIANGKRIKYMLMFLCHFLWCHLLDMLEINHSKNERPSTAVMLACKEVYRYIDSIDAIHIINYWSLSLVAQSPANNTVFRVPYQNVKKEPLWCDSVCLSQLDISRTRHKSKVVCCPMWLCIMWIIIINSLGVGCCIHKIYSGKCATFERMNKTMNHYRSVPKYKHFVDNLQWSLKCCGLNSYQDWFDNDWYDRIRDYEWDPNVMRRSGLKRNEKEVTDSVPLSCCKSGSCISNYLMELGTHSINTKGCGNLLYHIILGTMIAHLVVFLFVIIVEVAILRIIIQTDRNEPGARKLKNINVRHIMSVNDHFAASSNSLELNPDDTDYENEVHLGDVQLTDGDGNQSRMAVVNRVTIEDEDSRSPKYTKKWDDDDI